LTSIAAPGEATAARDLVPDELRDDSVTREGAVPGR
jgi:hypothetical protein